jgi:agmatine deiminase
MLLGASPQQLGFRMPAEWEPHARTWMCWPTDRCIWKGHETVVPGDYARVANAIAAFEPLTMLVQPRSFDEARALLDPSVCVQPLSIDDSWFRDTGPVFLVNGHGEKAAALFTFNAWGERFLPYKDDALAGLRVLEAEGIPYVTSSLVMEGGGILTDGEGTLIVAESNVLNSNRNPGWTKARADAEFKRLLGVDKVIWVPGDPYDAATDGHIDLIASFARPGVLVVGHPGDGSDPRSKIMRENRRVLELETDAKGRRFEILDIPEIGEEQAKGSSLFCRAYVNYYIANGGVVIPAYGSALDSVAAEVVMKAHPDRKVVQVDVGRIPFGGGGIHCITQQEPAAGRARIEEPAQ